MLMYFPDATPTAMAGKPPQNPLISTQKSSDTALQIALHPLVLLTISDYITRHSLRGNLEPVVGALLGQQNGREITIEHAFDCKLENNAEHQIVLHKVWFEERLQQMKDVHKVPALDLVGWWTILPEQGPQPGHLALHTQILQSYNESAILLGFHPNAAHKGTTGGKLPLSIYESNYEADESSGASGEDKKMEDGNAQLALRFKNLPYTVETGEAEMISVDFVARGGGNATAVDGTAKKSKEATTNDKGKAKEVTVPYQNDLDKAIAQRLKDLQTEREAKTTKEAARLAAKADKNTPHILSREDEELIASLTAKANAIKMLRSRINLIAAYLQKLPPSYTSNTPAEPTESEAKKYSPVNHEILRSIQALLSRLSLLIPADAAAFEKELMSEQNDVNLVSLLNSITDSIKDIRETGKKFAVVETGKTAAKQNDRGGPSSGQGNWGRFQGVLGVGDLLT